MAPKGQNEVQLNIQLQYSRSVIVRFTSKALSKKDVSPRRGKISFDDNSLNMITMITSILSFPKEIQLSFEKSIF
ncbi:hypothetical protein KFK09_004990 [Dendrobium nobile]|uniref:Uncharacterized protein n=1 Tax=Dendrobium nobile TaxID=94219 RepID=A0A8T3BUK8_DENNO|nr:hypothetical protein KFK09_004990 [Dendrobium nobile]